jgi:hypothetical protein
MPNLKKPTLDKDLDKLSYMEEAAGSLGRGLIAPGIALVFIVLCALGAGASMSGAPGTVIIVAAAAIGAYMALNIGANDVANNVGPAVGSRAMTLLTDGGSGVLCALDQPCYLDRRTCLDNAFHCGRCHGCRYCGGRFQCG